MSTFLPSQDVVFQRVSTEQPDGFLYVRPGPRTAWSLAPSCFTNVDIGGGPRLDTILFPFARGPS